MRQQQLQEPLNLGKDIEMDLEKALGDTIVTTKKRRGPSPRQKMPSQKAQTTKEAKEVTEKPQ